MKIERITNLQELICVLKSFDVEFTPTVSSIVGDMNLYGEKLYHNAITIGIYDDNRIVGFASFYCNDIENKTAYLTQIAVKKEYSSKGYGTSLIEASEKIAKENEMEKYRLEVYDENLIGINFYKRNGFEFEKRCTDKSIYMIKNI